jgi:glyoxylase-like metal-dependent hydrolase (beta-lactamase superfamily II)
VSQASDLYFQQVAVGQMANLAYLVGSRSTRQALVVDPAWSVDALLDQAEADEMEVAGALVTHYHQDHVGGSIFGMDIEGIPRLLERRPMPIHVNAKEADGLKQVTGASESDLVRHDAGDTIELGELRVRLLHTPGHTPGSQCFLVEENNRPGHLVAGDTLFLGSCGRIDLPGANPEDMYHSLNTTLKALPDETLLFPGHLYSS